MVTETKLDRFAKYSWFVVAFNLVVILWGVFLRASKSGDGCGQHWLTCHGEVIPSAPELKTIIEFSHRITSAIAFFAVLGLLIWTFRKFKKGAAIRKTAVVSFIFIVTEAAVGAGLVLTGNTADTLTVARPFWMAGHMMNTFVLLAFLVLTARYSSGGRTLSFKVERKYLIALAIGVAAIFVVGISGSIAALSHMIFPAGTLAEGIAKDFSPTSNIILRLRLLHPVTAILTGVFLVFLTGWMVKESAGDKKISRWSNLLALLVLTQLVFGAATLLMLAPIVMQLGHLFLADAIWVCYVLFAAAFLSRTED
ncbi:MAG: COX15/CtaA family protein [Chloracidobacterium sp.]|nr:COX15/CtaA family protein [Chloracidobacterium sp.]